MLISADVRVLHNVFGFVVVPDDNASHAIEALVIPPHDDLVERYFARQNAVDDFFVSPSFDAGFLQNLRDCHAHSRLPSV